MHGTIIDWRFALSIVSWEAILLTWININPGMDKLSHAR